MRATLWFIALIKEAPRCFQPWHHLHWQCFVAASPVSYDLSLCERFTVHLRVAPEFWCELWDGCFRGWDANTLCWCATFITKKNCPQDRGVQFILISLTKYVSETSLWSFTWEKNIVATLNWGGIFLSIVSTSSTSLNVRPSNTRQHRYHLRPSFAELHKHLVNIIKR